MYGSLFYSWKNCFLAFCLRDIMFFKRTIIWILWYKEAILTKSSQLNENSNKLAPKCKFLASNNEAILIY